MNEVLCQQCNAQNWADCDCVPRGGYLDPVHEERDIRTFAHKFYAWSNGGAALYQTKWVRVCRSGLCTVLIPLALAMFIAGWCLLSCIFILGFVYSFAKFAFKRGGKYGRFFGIKIYRMVY